MNIFNYLINTKEVLYFTFFYLMFIYLNFKIKKKIST